MMRTEIIERTKALETQRLSLRRLVMSDGVALFNTFVSPDNPEIADFASRMTLDDMKGWCDRAEKFNSTGRGYLAGVFNCQSQEPQMIGYAGITYNSKKEPDPDIWEIGFWFHDNFRNQGYATEAATALIEFGNKRLGLKGLFATTALDNASSSAVLIKSGFDFTKTTTVKVAGTDRPSNLYEKKFG